MSRSHRPPQPRQPTTSPSVSPRTALGVVVFTLAPPTVVLAADRPATAALIVAGLLATWTASLVAPRVDVGVAPRQVAVRVPFVSLRVEIGLVRADRGRS